MSARRFLAILVLAGLAVAGLIVPAAGQSIPPPPSISLSPTSDVAATSGTWSITVTGQGWTGGRVVSIQFAAENQVAFIPATGSWTRTITPPRRVAGTYTAVATSDVCGDGCIRTATAQFQAVPQVSLAPACYNPGTSQTLTVNGTAWNPQFQVTVTYDNPSSNAQVIVPATSGNFSAVFTVTPPNPPRDVVVLAEQGRTNSSVRAIWRACPPPASTTTSTTSTTQPTVPGSTTTAPTTTTPPNFEPGPTTTTSRPGIPGIPTTTTTLLPSIDVPPPTPGATLTVTPTLGTTGAVVGAFGTGFPAGAVELTWSGGLGKTLALVGPDGTFSARVLVFPRDRIGPRALVAVGGGVSSFAAFLVVPSSVQPSGQDVSQITRSRRFIQR